jgi:hypothetical protein
MLAESRVLVLRCTFRGPRSLLSGVRAQRHRLSLNVVNRAILPTTTARIIISVSTSILPLSSKKPLAFNMTFANFTKLSLELRDLIWAEAAAIQCQQVRFNSFKRNSSLLLLTSNNLLTITIVRII